MLSVWTWVHVLAALSSVVLAVLALSRHSNPRLRLPLVLLAADQFAWNAASMGRQLTQEAGYQWAGAVVTPVFAGIMLHFALAFTGRLQRFRVALLVAYALYALEAVVVIIDWNTGWLGRSLSTHALVAVATSVPIVLFGVWLLSRHFSSMVSEAERERTWLFVIALLVSVPLMLTDPFADMGFSIPSMATAGSCVLNGLLIVITLDLSDASPRQQFGQAVLLALFVVVGYLTLFGALRDHLGVLVLSVSAFSLALVAVGRLAWQWMSKRRENLSRFTTLGRFSAQMAHDLKNPLAAAKGASEYLQTELATLQRDDLTQFSGLLVQQLDRLTAIIDRYQRLSRVELSREPVEVNALLEKVLALQRLAAGGQTMVTTTFAPGLPTLSLDPELFSSAVENVVKNAFEAMPNGGTLTITTALEATGVRIAFIDTGEGMDPRTREQVFALFFTTKAQGSGLGLAFVRQLIRAHGGELRLHSAEGRGTTVEFFLPVSPAA